MRSSLALALGALAIVVSACSSGGGAASQSSGAAAGGTGGAIEGPTWKLSTIDEGGTPNAVPEGVFVDATFASGKVSGSAGCNQYSGPAAVSGATIRIGPLASTAMGCVGPGGDVEKAYLTALAAATSFTADATTLTLFDATGKASLVYAAGSANPLEGSWIVTGFNNGKQAVTSPINGTELTAVFTADSVSGSGGCNTYNGPYKLDGTKVTIGPLATTMKACEQAIMDQETQFLTALQTPANVETSGGTVTLRDSSGATQVVLGTK